MQLRQSKEGKDPINVLLYYAFIAEERKREDGECEENKQQSVEDQMRTAFNRQGSVLTLD
jgi:hypothetical protein